MTTRSETVSTASKEPVLTIDEFRAFMTHVNQKCRGIGCGYVRRDCRARTMNDWLRTWAGSDKAKILVLPRLRRTFNDELPDYFRDYSVHDRTIENEKAFRDVHERIVAALT